MKNNKHQKYYDLIFTFEYICINFEVNEDVYDEDDKKEIKNILKCITKKIIIDKSYVEFKENKHCDTFITENGWNKLCKLVIDTKKKCTKSQNEEKNAAYIMLFLSYIYLFFENLGYDTESLYFEPAGDTYFMVSFEKDTINEWKYYPGKWQTWKHYK